MSWRRVFSAWGGYPVAAAAVIAATLALLVARPFLQPAHVMLLYVPVIIAVARLSGVRASLAAAVAAFLALDLLFVRPYYMLSVALPADLLTLAVFLLVAAVAALQAGRMGERERSSLRRQAELESLNGLSSRLVASGSAARIAETVTAEVVRLLGVERAVLFETEGAQVKELAHAGTDAEGASERAFADWVVAHAKAIAPLAYAKGREEHFPASVDVTEPLSGASADGLYLPLQTRDGLEGALYVRPGETDLGVDEVDALLAVSDLSAAFLERRRLSEESSRAAATLESDRLKSTLISSVSHELKTPLAAATARVTGLVDVEDACLDERVRAELVAVTEDLSRLDSSIRDLLDVSRLESDAWRPRLEDWPVGEVLGSVSARLTVGGRDRVRFAIPDGLPDVRADFVQLGRAVSNLIDNALIYAPQGSPVTVGARASGDEVLVWVEDEGPGLADDEKEAVFGKFVRGSASSASPAGTGLGLAITREIARSLGGSVWVEDAQPHGARFVLALPRGGAQ